MVEEGDNKGDFVVVVVVVVIVVLKHLSNMLVQVMDGSPQTIICVVTLT